MTDYDLGKARGRIVIEHDERGFRKAEGANDKLATSAHRVAEGFIDAEKAQEDYEKQVKKTQQAEENLKKKQAEAQKALNRLNEAQALANRLKEEGKTKTERYKQAQEAAAKAQNRYSEAVNEAASAEGRLNSEVSKADKAFRQLDQALQQNSRQIDDVTKKLSGMNNALDKTQKLKKIKLDVDDKSALDKLKNLRKEHAALIRQLTSVKSLGTGTLKVSAIGAGGTALGGLAGLAGGGLTGFGVNGIMATVQAMGQLSGLAGLLPVVFGNLAATIGTTVIAFQGMGDAMDAIASNDAEKFAEALKNMSTNGKEFAFALNDLYPALEEFQKVVQDNFFKGLADEIRVLAQQYMPLLQNTFGGFANILNGTLRDLADWAKQSGVFADIQVIMENLKLTMGTLAPTARMLADIFLDITKVSSDFGFSIAASFQDAVKQFRDFINTARADGSLAQWIKTGIDSFKSLMGSIRNFAEAFGRIFQIQNQYGGGFFGFLERISAAFNKWTQSAEGNAALNAFFSSITKMADALTPVLASLATIVIGQIIPMFADFGTAIQPGLLAFFNGFSEALKILAPVMQQMAGPMNQLLTALGQSFAAIMKELGPQLPKIFQAFTDAILALLPHLPDIVKEIGQLATGFMEWMPFIAENIGDILPWLLQLADVILQIATVLTSAGILIVRWIGDIATSFDDLWNVLVDAFKTAGEELTKGWSWFFEQLGGLKDKLFKWFEELPGKAMESGRKIIEDLMTGMLDKLGPLGKVAKIVADAVSDYLPHSPAKKGPFSGSGWAKPRGEKLAQDFADGISGGSNEAVVAGGKLSKATESGIHQFVKDMLEFSSFGQNITKLFSDIANNIFTIGQIATKDPITGDSVFGKTWKRTVSDAELQRQQQDKIFKDQAARDQKAAEDAAKMLRPGLIQPKVDNDVPLRDTGYTGDQALLSRVPKTLRYSQKAGEDDLTKGLGDCTSSIEDLINIMDNRPTGGGRNMYTGNANEFLTARGFLPTDKLVPGAFNVGFYHNGGSDGHMQATLPGGTNWNLGGTMSAAAGGLSGGGAFDPNMPFTTHYYRPVSGGSPMNLDPALGANDQFQQMNDTLNEIAGSTADSAQAQDQIINTFRAQNPALEAAIQAAKNPNSTDAQVTDSLNTISRYSMEQRKQDNAQSRYIADGLDSMANTLAGDRGMTQQSADPFQQAQTVISGAFGLIGDGFKIFDATMKSIDSAAAISETLVRGVQNTEDIYNIVDQFQSFIELAGTISQGISDGLAFAGTLAAASGGSDGGGAAAALQAASAVAGVVTSVIQTVNAAIDLGQEAYRIGSKYVGKMLSFMVGGGNGSLLGDVKFLLDKSNMTLQTWSGDNPSDKRSFGVPSWLSFGQQTGGQQQGKIRDLNMYIGPGTDPNEAMNAAMWSIKTDQNGVYSGSGY